MSPWWQRTRGCREVRAPALQGNGQEVAYLRRSSDSRVVPHQDGRPPVHWMRLYNSTPTDAFGSTSFSWKSQISRVGQSLQEKSGSIEMEPISQFCVTPVAVNPSRYTRVSCTPCYSAGVSHIIPAIFLADRSHANRFAKSFTPRFDWQSVRRGGQRMGRFSSGSGSAMAISARPLRFRTRSVPSAHEATFKSRRRARVLLVCTRDRPNASARSCCR